MVSRRDCRLVVHDLLNDGGGSKMIYALIALNIVLLAVIIKHGREAARKQQELQTKLDFEHFCRTGNDITNYRGTGL